MPKVSISKKYLDIPFAHRQPNHVGHCRFIHGHNWSFEFEFEADSLDECGFVVDFGKLKWLKEALETWDHTLILNQDDPLQEAIKLNLGVLDLDNVLLINDCSCEGIARWWLEEVRQLLSQRSGFNRGVECVRVTVWEDYKNSATAKL